MKCRHNRHPFHRVANPPAKPQETMLWKPYNLAYKLPITLLPSTSWNGDKAPCGCKIVDAKVGGKEKKKLEIDPDIAPILKKVFEAYLAGIGFTKIAQLVTELNLLNPNGQPYTHSAVKHWIRGPFRFAGCMVWNTFSNQEEQILRIGTTGWSLPIVSPRS